MALSAPIGTPFKFRRDWKALFSKESWFMYLRNINTDAYVLRRFNIFNVAKFYFFRIVIALLSVALRPLALLAWHYWYNTEAEDFKTLTSAAFYVRDFRELPKFFYLTKKEQELKDIKREYAGIIGQTQKEGDFNKTLEKVASAVPKDFKSKEGLE